MSHVFISRNSTLQDAALSRGRNVKCFGFPLGGWVGGREEIFFTPGLLNPKLPALGGKPGDLG